MSVVKKLSANPLHRVPQSKSTASHEAALANEITLLRASLKQFNFLEHPLEIISVCEQITELKNELSKTGNSTILRLKIGSGYR